MGVHGHKGWASCSPNAGNRKPVPSPCLRLLRLECIPEEGYTPPTPVREAVQRRGHLSRVSSPAPPQTIFTPLPPLPPSSPTQRKPHGQVVRSRGGPQLWSWSGVHHPAISTPLRGLRICHQTLPVHLTRLGQSRQDERVQGEPAAGGREPPAGPEMRWPAPRPSPRLPGRRGPRQQRFPSSRISWPGTALRFPPPSSPLVTSPPVGGGGATAAGQGGTAFQIPFTSLARVTPLRCATLGCQGSPSEKENVNLLQAAEGPGLEPAP